MRDYIERQVYTSPTWGPPHISPVSISEVNYVFTLHIVTVIDVIYLFDYLELDCLKSVSISIEVDTSCLKATKGTSPV